MLQQILRDMWVDPEILAELDDAQKQTLFCKMREEQVRRWRIWDQKEKDEAGGKSSFQNNNENRKKVQFLNGKDGEPWVWVMGEHPDDKSIEVILAEETRQKAVEQARKEAQQLRKSVEKELTQLIDYKPLDSLEQKFDLSLKSVDSLEDTLEMYCTVDELRQRIDELQPELKIGDKDDSINENELDDLTDAGVEYRNEKNMKRDINKNSLNFNFIEGKKEVLQELDLCGGSGAVGSRVAAWERRVAAVRASDILRSLRMRRARSLRDSALHAADTEHAWLEQERKAKQAEATMREIARAAREEHRRTSTLEPSPVPSPLDGKPPNRDAVLEWFRTKELKRGAGLDEDLKPATWFHGLITRSEAEDLLSGQTDGSFLVRLSERVWGYAVSYKAGARCKHFLVDAGKLYRLLGATRSEHSSLVDLIKHHKIVPITESGGEILKTSRPPTRAPAILQAAILE